ncbi:MAG: hypothetical protein FWC93_06110 [Defluviitaleaceae bacterium]|nr:hypothetical protein [Defluviitaleaceae bacterium]
MREKAHVEEATHADWRGASDDLLRHLAKERVRRRRVLKWHLTGFVLTGFLNFVIFAGFWNYVLQDNIFFLWLGFTYGMIALWGVWIVRQIVIVMQERMWRSRPVADEVELEFKRMRDSEAIVK